LPRIDSDLDPLSPTIFECVPDSMGAVSMITRGLTRAQQIGRLAPLSALRAGYAHFTGNVLAAFGIDRDVARVSSRYIREQRPEFAFIALGTADKSSHAFGQDSPVVMDALRVVDDLAAEIRADAERDGRWDGMHLWVTSDHGHSRVLRHDDLAGGIAAYGFRTIAHPWTVAIAAEVGVMVSGNAMAHVYLDLEGRDRIRWPQADERWNRLARELESRPSVDLVILPTASGAIVRAAGRGDARVTAADGRYSYLRLGGDPLLLGDDVVGATADEAHGDAAFAEYPDAIVQIASLATAARSGDMILSGARDWDMRARYEPIDHVSSHGALHREHMLVPLLLNRPLAGSAKPRRTADIMPSALAALGRAIPHGLDGRSFIGSLQE
jgi:arylsulfatase A-like enzyme